MNKVTFLISNSGRTRRHTASVARKLHFMTRFRERVGYRLSETSYNELLRKVKTDGKFLYRRENELGAVYGILFNNSRMKVVYDAFSQNLITILSLK